MQTDVQVDDTKLTEDEKYQALNELLSLATCASVPGSKGKLQGYLWRDMLLALADDEEFDGVTYLGLRNAPAGKGNHHAWEGGLVAHMLEMWDTYLYWKEFPLLPPDPLITDANVLKGIIVHDLHKAWCEFVRDPAVDTGLNYGKHPSGNLVGNDQKSMYILNQHGVKIDLVICNVLYCSEGGWAKAPPRWCTTLSKLVYLLDEFSGNVMSRAADGTNFNVRSKLRLEPSFELKSDV